MRKLTMNELKRMNGVYTRTKQKPLNVLKKETSISPRATHALPVVRAISLLAELFSFREIQIG